MVKICYCEWQCRHKEEQGKTMLQCCYKGIGIKLSVMCKKGVYKCLSCRQCHIHLPSRGRGRKGDAAHAIASAW
jgi:hypothetical protein